MQEYQWNRRSPVGTSIAPQKASHLQTQMSAATQFSVIPPIPPLERSSDGKFVSHSLTGHAVARFLGVDPTSGLSNIKVSERRRQYGSNSIQSIRPRPAWRLLVDQFSSIVIALLAAAALVAWATGDVIEAIAILVVLVINALSRVCH